MEIDASQLSGVVILRERAGLRRGSSCGGGSFLLQTPSRYRFDDLETAGVHSVALKFLFALVFFREEQVTVEADLSYPRGVTVMRLKRRVNRAVCIYVNCSVM